MAKLSFSWQNFLSRGKTFFLTAKLTFLRQNVVPEGNAFKCKAKGICKRVKNGGQRKQYRRSVKGIFFKGFTYKEIRMFLHRNHGCIVSLRTLKRKIKRIGLRRRMPDYEMDAVRASVGGMIDYPKVILDTALFGMISK